MSKVNLNLSLLQNQDHFILFGTFFAFSLLAYALFSQHIGGYEPCVRCIFQRVAVLLILTFGLISLIGKNQFYVKIMALIGVALASIFGFYQANIHVGVIEGTIDDMCGFYADFILFGRLDEVIPWFFTAGGECADISWQTFGMTMPEWLKIFFMCYLLASVIIIGSLLRERSKSIV